MAERGWGTHNDTLGNVGRGSERPRDLDDLLEGDREAVTEDPEVGGACAESEYDDEMQE